MSKNQVPPQLPPEAPKSPPQLPPQNQPQYQQPQHQYNHIPPKKKMSTGVKVLIGLGALFVFICIMAVIFGDDKTNQNDSTAISSTLNEANKKWKDKAIMDSTNIADGYFASSSMTESEVFIKRYHELELLSLQQTPKDVTDSTIIRMGNRNANNAMGILIDSVNVYRNQFTKLLEKKLWMDNIKVKTQNGGKTLWLIGGLFASNRNISEFHNGMLPMFKALGYKRICYKWVDVSSAEYTYYDLDK